MKRFFLLAVTAIMFMSCNLGPNAIIKAGVWAYNAECPDDLGNGFTMTQVADEGRYVKYFVMGDDDMYEFDQSMADGEVRQAILEDLRSESLTDDDLRQFLDALRQTGRGLIYHYYTTSGTSMDVVIDCEMLP